MEIISLIDNKENPLGIDLHSEHGLAVCIRTKGRYILFDTGASGIFLSNAQRLDVNIADISHAVLSHHHFDHGGGLAAFFEVNSQAKLYLRNSKTEHYYLHFLGFFRRRIGLNASLFQQYPQRVTYIDQFSEIASDVFILTQIGKRHLPPKGNRHLFVHEGKSKRLDDFEHELILVVKESGSLVVFTGCSHHGILNMLDAVMDHFPNQNIKAVFGGFHLIDRPSKNSMAGSRSDVEALGQAIMKYPIGKVYTGHCTGSKAYGILKEVMGEKLEYFATGCRVEL
jgi:7,8-dihydropterin-6-yl-methyl-4-(beta-D-ribofuranosyl)aminobenzene 5'-phosphate synthase